MKNFLSLSLSLLILQGCFQDISILLAFKANQEYIAENLCINRFNLESDCKGKCILMQKLTESRKKESKTPFPIPEIEQVGTSLYVVSEQKDNLIKRKKIKTQFNSFDDETWKQLYVSSIFHPPKG